MLALTANALMSKMLVAETTSTIYRGSSWGQVFNIVLLDGPNSFSKKRSK